jgi:ferredoxin--NADP+ reductase
MCGGCRVTVGGEPQFACVDGPCFDAHEVDFDEAMRRNKAYVREEKAAVDRLNCQRAMAGDLDQEKEAPSCL